MKLWKLLEIHRSSAPKGSLPKNLGDGYLMKSNALYRNVRQAVLKLGYQFTTDRLYQYDALSLSQIHHLIAKKRIPFIDNVTILSEIEKRKPRSFSWHDIPDLKRNTLLHESAHCLSRSLTLKWFGKRQAESTRVMSYLIEESFANTCDAWVGGAGLSECHTILAALNCYVLFEEHKKVVQKFSVFGRLLGKRVLFQTIFILYLNANFLCENFNEAGFAELLELVIKRNGVKSKSLSPTQMKRLYQFLSFPYLLNLEFRYRTNDFYFRFQGFNRKIESLLCFDHMKVVADSDAFWNCLNDLTDAALTEHKKNRAERISSRP